MRKAFRRSFLAVALGTVLGGFGRLESSAVGIQDILRQVEAETLTSSNYSARVHQTVTRAQGSGAAAPAAAQATVLAEEEYAVNCSTSGDVRMTRQLSSKRTAEGSMTDPSAARKTGGGLITVNAIRALRHVADLPSPEITDDLCGNVASYKISASEKHYDFLLWVDKSEPCIRRLIVRQDAKVIFDTTFAYKRWNGVLVPARVEISKPSSGVTMVQEYSEQTF
jgi:hypothetical protein